MLIHFRSTTTTRAETRGLRSTRTAGARSSRHADLTNQILDIWFEELTVEEAYYKEI